MSSALLLQLLAILGAVLQAGIEDGPIILKTAEDATIFMKQLFNKLLGRDPTADEEAAIYEQIQTLSAQLQTPLPPAQDDDT